MPQKHRQCLWLFSESVLKRQLDNNILCFPSVFLHVIVLAGGGVTLIWIMNLIIHSIWNVLIRTVSLGIRHSWLVSTCLPLHWILKVIIKESNLGGSAMAKLVFSHFKTWCFSRRKVALFYIQLYFVKGKFPEKWKFGHYLLTPWRWKVRWNLHCSC